jgi:hypothetical protein
MQVARAVDALGRPSLMSLVADGLLIQGGGRVPDG